MLFQVTFISTSEKIGVGLEKQATIFYFNFTRRWVVQYSCFEFFHSALWRYFQLSGLWNTNLTYQIRRTATYVYVEIHKRLNFPSICSGNWNICAEYDLQGPLPHTGALTLTGTRKPTVRCLITLPDYTMNCFANETACISRVLKWHVCIYLGDGWVVRRCRVSYVTGVSYWYWLTDGQSLLSL